MTSVVHLPYNLRLEMAARRSRLFAQSLLIISLFSGPSPSCAALAGCSGDPDTSACLNDEPGQPVCCATSGSCSAGFNLVVGAPRCGERYSGRAGGTYKSTCCYAQQTTNPSPLADGTTCSQSTTWDFSAINPADGVTGTWCRCTAGLRLGNAAPLGCPTLSTSSPSCTCQ
jgi:hypothetical protein